MRIPRGHDYENLTPLVSFPHPDPSDLPDRSLDVMSDVTPCHVPQTVTSDVPSTLTSYNNGMGGFHENLVTFRD